MEFTHEQISEIISEITNGELGLQGLVKQGLEIVFQKVCKFQFIYFCNRTVKNNLLWNLHMSK